MFEGPQMPGLDKERHWHSRLRGLAVVYPKLNNYSADGLLVRTGY